MTDLLPGHYGLTGYRAARTATGEGRIAATGSAVAHYQYHRAQLINQSRDFHRNNAIYVGMIERAVSYIMGSGFQLQPHTGDHETDRLVDGLWREYWKKPDVRGLLKGSKVERMICRETMICGDTAALKLRDGSIQLFEAEQINGGSKCLDGIEVNDYGKPIRFYLTPYSKLGYTDTGKVVAKNPADVLYVANLDRPSAIRGVPPCQSAFPMLHRINDVCDSEAIAWQLLARIALSVTRAGGPLLAGDESIEDEAATGDEAALRIHEMGYALMFHGEPGDTVTPVDRNIPGKDFPESIRMFLRLLGLPLGLPLEIILLDWTNSNYSQSRAVLEQAYTTFLDWQDLIEGSFHDPLLQWKMAEWKRDGLIPKDTPVAHEWVRPTFPWIDQLKEATANAAKLDRSLTTYGRVCKSQGFDASETLDARVNEVLRAIQIAKEIEIQTGVKVPWQPFAGMEIPKESVGLKSEDEDNEDDNAQSDAD